MSVSIKVCVCLCVFSSNAWQLDMLCMYTPGSADEL